jgi:hypothetical protein
MPDFHLLLLRRDAVGTDVVLDRVVDRTANELNRALQTNHTVGSPLQRTTRSPVEAHRGSCGHHRVVLERRELVGRDVLVFLSLERAAKVLRWGERSTWVRKPISARRPSGREDSSGCAEILRGVRVPYAPTPQKITTKNDRNAASVPGPNLDNLLLPTMGVGHDVQVAALDHLWQRRVENLDRRG